MLLWQWHVALDFVTLEDGLPPGRVTYVRLQKKQRKQNKTEGSIDILNSTGKGHYTASLIEASGNQIFPKTEGIPLESWLDELIYHVTYQQGSLFS